MEYTNIAPYITSTLQIPTPIHNITTFNPFITTQLVKKRKNYTKETPELKLEVAKYAVEKGVAAALRQLNYCNNSLQMPSLLKIL